MTEKEKVVEELERLRKQLSDIYVFEQLRIEQILDDAASSVTNAIVMLTQLDIKE